jgi:hypothetical protein
MVDQVPKRGEGLRDAGIVVFAVGLLALIATFMLPSTLPPPSAGAALGLESYQSELQEAMKWVEWRRWTTWLSDHLIAGGFFMWLTGILVREMNLLRGAE